MRKPGTMKLRTHACGITLSLLMIASAMSQTVPNPAARSSGDNYQPRWESLDRRSNPAWFDDDKIGIFIHWSVFSVPAIAYVYPDKPYGFGGHSCWYGLYVDRIATLSPAEQAKLEAFHRKPRRISRTSWRKLRRQRENERDLLRRHEAPVGLATLGLLRELVPRPTIQFSTSALGRRPTPLLVEELDPGGHTLVKEEAYPRQALRRRHPPAIPASTDMQFPPRMRMEV